VVNAKILLFLLIRVSATIGTNSAREACLLSTGYRFKLHCSPSPWCDFPRYFPWVFTLGLARQRKSFWNQTFFGL